MEQLKPLCDLSDEEVVRLAQSGDEQALEHIIIRYRNFVYSKAKKFFLIGSEPDDLIQEGMIGLYEAVKSFKHEKASFAAFAGICIRRQMISAVKTATRNKHKPLNSYVSLDKSVYDAEGDSKLIESVSEKYPQNPEAIVIDKENLSGIESTINRTLSKLELEVLMYYLDGYSYQQIAEKIDRDVKAVDNAIQRIKRKIESVIGGKNASLTS